MKYFKLKNLLNKKISIGLGFGCLIILLLVIFGIHKIVDKEYIYVLGEYTGISQNCEDTKCLIYVEVDQYYER